MEIDGAEDLLSGNGGYHLRLYEKEQHLHEQLSFVIKHKKES